MAISIQEHARELKSINSTYGVSTYIPHLGIHIELGRIRLRLEPDHGSYRDSDEYYNMYLHSTVLS